MEKDSGEMDCTKECWDKTQEEGALGFLRNRLGLLRDMLLTVPQYSIQGKSVCCCCSGSRSDSRWVARVCLTQMQWLLCCGGVT